MPCSRSRRSTRGARAGPRPGAARRALRAVAVVGAHDLDAELKLAGDLDPAGAVGGSPIAAAVALAQQMFDMGHGLLASGLTPPLAPTAWVRSAVFSTLMV